MGKNIKKTIVIFEFSTLKFVYLQNFTKKQKYLNLGAKMPYFGIFEKKNASFLYFWGGTLENTIVIFEINTLKFVHYENFTKKQKYLNLGPKMPYLGIFGLEF